jgi:ATP-dependent DNA ligase
MTTDISVAEDWLQKQRSSLDGIVAKRRDLPYVAGERSAVQKFKRIRTADCVVGGFRYASSSKNAVGSLLLGLYEDGLLHHVGFASGIKTNERKTLLKQLKPLIEPPGFTGRAPGGPSRWSTERSAQWQPLQPELVLEVSFDHVTANRFRHGTRILRWRPDKEPGQCTMDQIVT